MATLTAQVISRSGVAPSYSAVAAGGDQVIINPKTFLHFKNTNASARNVTLDSVKACDQGFDHNEVVNIPATTGDVLIGPFPTRFADANGYLQLAYDADAGLTVAALELG